MFSRGVLLAVGLLGFPKEPVPEPVDGDPCGNGVPCGCLAGSVGSMDSTSAGLVSGNLNAKLANDVGLNGPTIVGFATLVAEVVGEELIEPGVLGLVTWDTGLIFTEFSTEPNTEFFDNGQKWGL